MITSNGTNSELRQQRQTASESSRTYTAVYPVDLVVRLANLVRPLRSSRSVVKEFRSYPTRGDNLWLPILRLGTPHSRNIPKRIFANCSLVSQNQQWRVTAESWRHAHRDVITIFVHAIVSQSQYNKRTNIINRKWMQWNVSHYYWKW